MYVPLPLLQNSLSSSLSLFFFNNKRKQNPQNETTPILLNCTNKTLIKKVQDGGWRGAVFAEVQGWVSSTHRAAYNFTAETLISVPGHPMPSWVPGPHSLGEHIYRQALRHFFFFHLGVGKMAQRLQELAAFPEDPPSGSQPFTSRGTGILF